ncbi:unnamed protein product [Notodromas monacha]|uniref:Alkaline phosphatase n=1 Tax=Notodromas monacha TaxID=399045 RepID=A0A7R9G7H6_9CRUS|nr:unnamed protein product [Notodromas monacha]CAG0912215.1 unnamed protein product [Notodromas monacha]
MTRVSACSKVEGARIDHALHDNSAKLALEETLAFDAAVEAALNATDPEDTLIIVTADHSHVMTINGYPNRGNNILGESHIFKGLQEQSFVAHGISYAACMGPQRAICKRATHRHFWQASMKDEIWKTITARRNCAKAKNIVVFIGDGMGIPVITAARILKGQKAGKTGEETFLNFEKFPYTGLMRTYCTDKQVPDSACTGTALFSGIKAPYYTLGVDVHAKYGECKETMKYKSYFPESIMTYAQAAEKLTGFVTTSRVTHATPAATYAHSPHREWECDGKLPPEATECKDIARQMIEDAPARDFHVIMGGGRQFFFPNETYNQNRSETQCQRRDGRKLVETWMNDKKSRNATYKYVTTTSELQDAMRNKPDYLLGRHRDPHYFPTTKQ